MHPGVSQLSELLNPLDDNLGARNLYVCISVPQSPLDVPP